MSILVDITLNSIIEDINSKIEEVKSSSKSSKEKEDIVFGLVVAKQIVANHY